MSKSKKRKAFVPIWCTELVCDEDDVRTVLELYTHFELTPDPVLRALGEKVEAGGAINLEDQKLLARCFLADIAKQSWKVFTDPMFREIGVECARHLFAANKHETK